MSKLQDKVIIITGASSGIGKSLAEEAMKKGMRTVLAARNTGAMEQYTSEKNWDPNRFLIVKTDVSVEQDCRELINQTAKKFGAIDVLVNNAGISMRALFSDMELSVIKKLMDVNFWGTVYCTHYAMPWLLKSKGSVVGVSSIAGYRGLPARTGYSASKFAMQGFLESLRTENLKTGLHVLVACPGFTASNIRKTALVKDGTAQGESPRNEHAMMQPQTVAAHILKAVEKRKRTLVLTTQGKITVWLNKWFPAWTDKLVYNHIASEPDSPFK
ncbi:MAG: SDR family oxidoreductase [Bacteroidetes bacterium]|nr:MAG: SDR family oxidoreductase [Bacteroidota bacterium]